MNVSLWGSYAHGNFGDDAMAIMISEHLLSRGITPLVYGLPQELGMLAGINVTADANVVLANADLGIVGGGSLLQGGKSSDGRYAAAKAKEYNSFLNALNKHKTPLFYVSIGSGGESDFTSGISDYRKELLAYPHAVGATVRIASDAKQLQAVLRSRVDFFPDILLSFGNAFKKRRAKTQFLVGLNKEARPLV